MQFRWQGGGWLEERRSFDFLVELFQFILFCLNDLEQSWDFFLCQFRASPLQSDYAGHNAIHSAGGAG